MWWGGDARKRPTARRVVTLGEGWLSREAADYDEIAASVDNIRAVCEQHDRDPSTIGVRASLTATGDWEAATTIDELTERAIARAQRLTQRRRDALQRSAELLRP